MFRIITATVLDGLPMLSVDVFYNEGVADEVYRRVGPLVSHDVLNAMNAWLNAHGNVSIDGAPDVGMSFIVTAEDNGEPIAVVTRITA